MKDAEFIELLNLYVDHEISGADATRLEAEVQSDPERRRTYQEYCRVQKACKLLAHDFQAEAAAITERKVLAFEPAERETRRSGFYLVGALTAAACVAMVLVGLNRQKAPGEMGASSQIAQDNAGAQPAVAASAVVAPAQAPAQTIAHAVRVPPGQPSVAGNPLLLSGRAQADAIMAAAVEQANAQFEWMRTVQLAPLQQPLPLENLFQNRPASLQLGNRPYGIQQPLDGNVESAGFRFQK